MLGALRSKKNNPVIIILLGFVVVLMAGFGVSFSTGDASQWAARVNGESIPYGDYSRAYSSSFRAQQRRNPSYDRTRAEAENLRQQVLDQMIGTKLLAMEAQRRGLRVDDETLRKQIFEIPAFQIDGRFDPETYERAIRSERSNPVAFEAELRETLLANQLRSIVQGAGPSEAEIRSAWEEQNTKLAIDFVKIPVDSFAEDVGEVSPADVEAWETSAEDADAAILARYQRFKASRYDVPKQVCARHILIRTPKETPPDIRDQNRKRLAGAAKQVVDGKKTFEEAAKEYSDDSTKSKGGDLGCFGPGQMVPKFEEAAFGLEPGKMSDVVETMFGYHVIQVYDVKEPIRRTLDDARDELRRELAETTKAKRVAEDFAATLLASAKTEGSLQTAVDKAGEGASEGAPKLLVEESGDFTRTQRFVAKLGTSEEVLKS
ncbi:MAG: SurA N-terminal domain-containing protein, partial [Myxococcota bacterium]